MFCALITLLQYFKNIKPGGCFAPSDFTVVLLYMLPGINKSTLFSSTEHDSKIDNHFPAPYREINYCD